ncbi:right-handed parallel beta-helix repeat-containing protein [bacterium]|nr:right-handed parallel beta-helix repeat-containing protein [bacterium]
MITFHPFGLRFVLAALAVTWLVPVLPADPNPQSDLAGWIASRIAAGEKRIVIPPGKYRVMPKDRQHLRFADLSDIEIIADGVELICTQTTRAVSVSNCHNLAIRGLTIDYDPLPFTEGRIVAMNENKSRLEIDLFDGYTTSGISTKKFEIFDPETATLRTPGTYFSIEVEQVEPKRIVVTKTPYTYLPDRHVEQVGDIIVIAAYHAPDGRVPHAVACENSENVRLENITVYSSEAFGFLEHDCDDTEYIGCVIDRRAPEDDLKTRAWPRMRSLNADGFHSIGARRGPRIEGCTARFQGDDCVNIHGDYHMILAAESPTVLRVLAKTRMNIEPGDPTELMAFAGVRLPDAKVLSVEPAGEITDEERAYLQRQSLHELFKTRLHEIYLIQLDRPVEVGRGGLICSSNRIGNGFVVRGNDFSHVRSRGILIKASDGIVADNRIEGTKGHGIVVQPEYWWLEAGSSNNLTIENNTLRDISTIALCVTARGGDRSIAPAGAHRNILIAGNTIESCPAPGIVVTSTEGLALRDNALDLDPNRRLMSAEDLAKDHPGEPIVLINVEQTD